jgi:hypothetical protein
MGWKCPNCPTECIVLTAAMSHVHVGTTVTVVKNYYSSSRGDLTHLVSRLYFSLNDYFIVLVGCS